MTEEEPLRQPLQEIALVDNKALASFIIGYGVGVSTVEAGRKAADSILQARIR